MTQYTWGQLDNSIATKLLKVVFSFYFLVTITVTLIHMSAEYVHTQDTVVEELKVIQQAFESGLTQAAFDLNVEQLKPTLVGMVQLPSVVGVKLENEYGEVVGALGMIRESESSTVLTDEKGVKLPMKSMTGLFWHEFPLMYERSERVIPVGKATIYSSSAIVFNKVQLGFTFIVVNSIIKTLALWLIFLWVSRALLSRPLAVLTEAARQVELDNLEHIRVDTQVKGQNELKVLEKAFNAMIRKLGFSRNALQTSYQRLETLLHGTQDIAAVHDRFHAMTQATNLLLLQIPFKACRSAQICFLETGSNNSEGYACFNINIKLTELSRPALQLDSVKDLEHFFSLDLPERLPPLPTVPYAIFEHVLYVPLFQHDRRLLGLIKIQEIDELGFQLENQYVVIMLTQFLSAFLENLYFTQQLERKVAERTQELQGAMQKMKSQNEQLKETQMQLVQSEKMAGLGVLVAGVAHEINNPTNFVHSGANNLSERITKLEDFIYKLAGDDISPPIREALSQKFSPVHQNLQAIQEGTRRIKNIVQDLRMFSRLEDAEQTTSFVVEGLQATLTLVKSNYKNELEFICDFQANPKMRCWPAQLNQVFMNLATNACQAITIRKKQKFPGYSGRLTVSTFWQKELFAVRFKDNGCGIPDDVKKQIFDPFFTTKPVGEGTGLGLSISFGIIEKHRGRIEVESLWGKGTTFTLLLPVEN